MGPGLAYGDVHENVETHSAGRTCVDVSVAFPGRLSDGESNTEPELRPRASWPTGQARGLPKVMTGSADSPGASVIHVTGSHRAEFFSGGTPVSGCTEGRRARAQNPRTPLGQGEAQPRCS